MEMNKLNQIIALCDSIPVMLDTQILDAGTAIKTLALIRQLAEEEKAARLTGEAFNIEKAFRAGFKEGCNLSKMLTRAIVPDWDIPAKDKEERKPRRSPAVKAKAGV